MNPCNVYACACLLCILYLDRRKSSCVKEVERLKKNREDRRYVCNVLHIIRYIHSMLQFLCLQSFLMCVLHLHNIFRAKAAENLQQRLEVCFMIYDLDYLYLCIHIHMKGC